MMKITMVTTQELFQPEELYPRHTVFVPSHLSCSKEELLSHFTEETGSKAYSRGQ